MSIPISVSVSSKIKHIVISGGGAAGFSFYGALKSTHERGIWNIRDIERIYSTSAGSMISVFLALEYEWKIMDDYIIKRPWNQVYKCELPMAVQAIKNQGLFNQTVIQETFTPLFHGKDISLDITLEDFFQLNQKELHFISTDFNSFEYVDISYKTHPKWKVLDAVYASCCLPILFSPFYKKDDHDKMCVYLDGGIRMNYPLDVCLKDNCHPSEILGIRRVDPEKKINNEILPSFSLFDIIYKLFYQYTKKIEIPLPDMQIRYQYDIRFTSMDLNAIFRSLSSEEERIKLIEIGCTSSTHSSSNYIDLNSESYTVEELNPLRG
jgi:predicted acylesterase/phospholipase RssA